MRTATIKTFDELTETQKTQALNLWVKNSAINDLAYDSAYQTINDFCASDIKYDLFQRTNHEVLILARLFKYLDVTPVLSSHDWEQLYIHADLEQQHDLSLRLNYQSIEFLSDIEKLSGLNFNRLKKVLSCFKGLELCLQISEPSYNNARTEVYFDLEFDSVVQEVITGIKHYYDKEQIIKILKDNKFCISDIGLLFTDLLSLAHCLENAYKSASDFYNSKYNNDDIYDSELEYYSSADYLIDSDVEFIVDDNNIIRLY